ncbi:MAG TPA: alpha/beta fold hydrolase [Tepidisphaeraceae bacterium]|nr:alpha/beta fold hydrolase [Tepidisphaeraceae bacterium]
MKTRRPRRFGRTILRAALIYCVVALVLAGCASKLILHPTREAIPANGATRLQVLGPVETIEIWTMHSRGVRGREPRAFVIEFIGNAARAEWGVEDVSADWGDRPVEVWAVNYPGYGGSAGSASLKSIAPAALAAYDAMKKKAGDRPTFVSGHSIGTTAALCVAAHRPVSGLVLYNPPPLRKLIMGRFGWWNLWLAAIPVSLQVPGELDSLANGRKCSAPAVFVLGEADEVVPPRYHQMVVDAYAGPKQLVRMPGATHNDPVSPEALPRFEAELDWLWKEAGAGEPATERKWEPRMGTNAHE